MARFLSGKYLRTANRGVLAPGQKYLGVPYIRSPWGTDILKERPTLLQIITRHWRADFGVLFVKPYFFVQDRDGLSDSRDLIILEKSLRTFRKLAQSEVGQTFALEYPDTGVCRELAADLPDNVHLYLTKEV